MDTFDESVSIVTLEFVNADAHKEEVSGSSSSTRSGQNHSTVESRRTPVNLADLQEAVRDSVLAGEALRKVVWWSDPTQSISGSNIKTLSEYQVMRELIWALDNPADCFIIYKTDCGYKPREMITLLSISQIDFYEEILQVCPYLDIKETLDNFIQSIMEINIDNISLPDTYIAYIFSLKKIISNYQCDLYAIESQVVKQDDINTISSVLNRLSPWFDVLKMLHQVHQKGIMSDWKGQENWKCSLRLLAVLCECLKDYEGWNKSILMILFLCTLEPYLNIMERWLLNKSLIDLKNEFLIFRPSKSVGEENLMIRDYMEVLNTIGVTNSLFIQNLIYFSYRACSSVDFLVILQRPVSIMEQSTNSLNDEFLISVLNDVSQLGVKFADISDSRFCQHLGVTQHLNHNCPEKEILKVDDSFSEMSPRRLSGRPGSCTNNLHLVLDSIFASFGRNKNCFDVHSNNRLFNEMEHFNTNQLDCEKLLKDNFNGLISKWMQPKGFAKEILLVNYDLLGHLTALKMVYLLQDGVSMNDFVKSLFTNQVLKTDDWLFNSWTGKLQDFLCETIPAYVMNFSVVFENRLEVSSKQFINLLNSISIQYQRLPPLNLVITNTIIDRYNELFRFLIKLNWAYYSIKNINIGSLSKKNANVTGRLYSLRTFLFHNISTLSNYFFSLICDTSYDKIVHLCSIARDIQVITSALEKILDNLKKRCFLVDAPACYTNIIKIIELCGNLKAVWEKAESSYVLPDLLDSFETKYKEVAFSLADDLMLLETDTYFQNCSHFKHLSGEIMNNMPGSWDVNDS